MLLPASILLIGLIAMPFWNLDVRVCIPPLPWQSNMALSPLAGLPTDTTTYVSSKPYMACSSVELTMRADFVARSYAGHWVQSGLALACTRCCRQRDGTAGASSSTPRRGRSTRACWGCGDRRRRTSRSSPQQRRGNARGPFGTAFSAGLGAAWQGVRHRCLMGTVGFTGLFAPACLPSAWAECTCTHAASWPLRRRNKEPS